MAYKLSTNSVKAHARTSIDAVCTHNSQARVFVQSNSATGGKVQPFNSTKLNY